jgi:hypothetical protein
MDQVAEVGEGMADALAEGLQGLDRLGTLELRRGYLGAAILART